MKEIKVTFIPLEQEVYILPGTTVMEAAAIAGIILTGPCGGKGKCGKCQIILDKCQLPPSTADKNCIPKELLKRCYRLACQTKIMESCSITIPDEVSIQEQRILLNGIAVTLPVDPAVKKYFLEIDPPVLADDVSDFDQLRIALQHKVPSLSVNLSTLSEIPEKLRTENYKVTAVTVGDELISVEGGDTTGKNYGIACDVGTTTVAAGLVDLNSGKEIALGGSLNKQVIHGDDVISRIAYVRASEGGLETLHKEIIAVVNSLISDVSEEAQINPGNIYELTCVGNTIMHHIFLGLSPANIATIPFTPVYKDAIDVKASRLGIRVNPQANVHFLPNVAGFLGADMVGVVLATSLSGSDKVKLAIDIGTNGEVVLGSGRKMLAVSCATGPAFEGAHISHGMRAVPGAIEQVVIRNDEVEISVIKGKKPLGICGSGLVDALAELLRLGVLDETGRMKTRDELGGKLTPKLLKRIVTTPEGPKFLLMATKKKNIFITQNDVRKLQLAKGAIRAAISILLGEFGIDMTAVSEVLIAGAFGNYINRENALRIGLMPPIPAERIKYVGNAARIGAKLTVVSRQAREQAQIIARSIKYLELSAHSNFHEEFARAMYLPYGE